MADSILHDAKIATNSVPSFVEAIAIRDEISATGTNDDLELKVRSVLTLDCQLPALNLG